MTFTANTGSPRRLGGAEKPVCRNADDFALLEGLVNQEQVAHVCFDGNHTDVLFSKHVGAVFHHGLLFAAIDQRVDGLPGGDKGVACHFVIPNV